MTIDIFNTVLYDLYLGEIINVSKISANLFQSTDAERRVNCSLKRILETKTICSKLATTSKIQLNVERGYSTDANFYSLLFFIVHLLVLNYSF